MKGEVTSLSEALKSNTTLTELNLSGEDKKKEDAKQTSINTLLFPLSLQINRQQHRRRRCGIIE